CARDVKGTGFDFW
nr:immunoglobulin heavy chain junction region [Macaca mulatta]